MCLNGAPRRTASRCGGAASSPRHQAAQCVRGLTQARRDAAFATDLDWLIDNLRWDVQDDLARIVGDAPARQIGRVGGWLAGALREGAKALRDLTARAPGGDTSTTRR